MSRIQARMRWSVWLLVRVGVDVRVLEHLDHLLIRSRHPLEVGLDARQHAGLAAMHDEEPAGADRHPARK